MSRAVPSISKGEKASTTRDGRGRFVKGMPGGPGRTPIVKDLVRTLDEAIHAEEGAGLSCVCQCTTFRQHFLRRALRNDSVLTVLMNKLYPNAEALTEREGLAGIRPLVILVHTSNGQHTAVAVS